MILYRLGRWIVENLSNFGVIISIIELIRTNKRIKYNEEIKQYKEAAKIYCTFKFRLQRAEIGKSQNSTIGVLYNISNYPIRNVLILRKYIGKTESNPRQDNSNITYYGNDMLLPGIFEFKTDLSEYINYPERYSTKIYFQDQNNNYWERINRENPHQLDDDECLKYLELYQSKETIFPNFQRKHD
jgi:hypothetical protein